MQRNRGHPFLNPCFPFFHGVQTIGSRVLDSRHLSSSGGRHLYTSLSAFLSPDQTSMRRRASFFSNSTVARSSCEGMEKKQLQDLAS